MSSFMKALARRLFGRLYWVQHSDRLRYKGAWRSGAFHGLGQLEYENGTTYQGSFKYGHKHGFGRLISPTNYSYHGDWISGHQTGSATVSYKNGDTYTGYVQNGLRHGRGELDQQSTQRQFSGVWNNETLQGEVRIVCADWVFEGQFPTPDGITTGTLSYSNGVQYSGGMKNFKRHGMGMLVCKPGVQIEGLWTDNVDVAEAHRIDEAGVQWRGALKNLKPQGFMKIQLPNGEKYDGMWDNGDLQRVLSVKNKMGGEPVYHIH